MSIVFKSVQCRNESKIKLEAINGTFHSRMKFFFVCLRMGLQCMVENAVLMAVTVAGIFILCDFGLSPLPQ